jgi:uncharacterized cupin superfamily protein
MVEEIKIEKDVSQERLRDMGVLQWPIWTKEVSVFPWTYDGSETCFFLEGDVIVTPEGGEPVRMGKGDLVTFPDGMNCTWDIRAPVRKHFSFEL